MQLELRRRSPKSPLAVHAKDIYSQSGEDGIIAHVLRVLQPGERYCVEFGAWDGRHLSNCHALLTRPVLIGASWRGLMIEANTEKFQELRATYRAHPDVHCMNRLVDFEGPNKLDNLLAEAGAPRDFALLSIDIDGNDYHVWESLNDYRPEIVVIEFNPTVPNDVVFVQDKSFDVNQGCSVLALIELGRRKGYELAATTAFNAIFVIAAKYALLGIDDNSIDAIHAPLLDGRIFQGYDNSIHVVGMEKMLWMSNKKLSADDFQVLPKSRQGWRDGQRREAKD